MKAVHFGGGNIGRGFIGEVLAQNNYDITFVDINERVINELKVRKSYQIALAQAEEKIIEVNNVTGVNSQQEPKNVVEALAVADIVTTAIGPKVLPQIAKLLATGLKERMLRENHEKIDVIACENMIGGSQFLKKEVAQYLTPAEKDWLEEFVGFPNAAVDRIVPLQHHEDPLYVVVEPFKEWIVEAPQQKGPQLKGVHYVADLTPYIERKLFSVNTGHATVAYTGAYFGYQTIDEAMKDIRVRTQLEHVLEETGSLLVAKWGFDPITHTEYIEKILQRFENPYISDGIQRVARTPLRKLGYDERFIRPIRELSQRELSYQALLETVGYIFSYHDENDPEAQNLHNVIRDLDREGAIHDITGLTEEEIILAIKNKIA